MVSPPTRKNFSKEETPYATPTTSPSLVQPTTTLYTSTPQQLNPRPSLSLRNEASGPDSPDTSGEDFLADIFSDSDDDSDSDSDDDRRTYPKFDYDARFRPLQNLDLSQVRDPGPGAELCYALEDFAPENMRSWCLPDFVSSDVFAIVKGGEPVDFITELNEFFWLVRVHSTGKPGVVPAFNIEGQLERKARENKEVNEKQSRHKAAHKRALKEKSAFDEDKVPTVFVEDETNEQPRSPRSVGFKSILPQKVFRYVAPEYTPVGKETAEPVSWVEGWVEVVCPEEEAPENPDAWRPGRGRNLRQGFRRFRV